MPPKRTAAPLQEKRPSKQRRVVTPRPRQLDLDFDNTIHLTAYLLDDALQGNGREPPFYHGLLEAFTHFSRCSRQKNTRISVSSQYALCNDQYPEGIEVTRDEPVATRSSNVLAHQALDEDEEREDDFVDQLVVSSDSADVNLEAAHETYRSPDFIFWKAIIDVLENRVRVFKLPFALVEVKPLNIDFLLQVDKRVRMEDIAMTINSTRTQVQEQLEALWREFRMDPDMLPYVFVFIFIGKYFAFYKVRHGVTVIPHARGGSVDHISCLLNDEQTDFSDVFQQRWKEMMNTYNIPIIPGFLRV